MTVDPEERVATDPELADLCEQLAEVVTTVDMTVATAESLTAGNLAAHLGRAPDSGAWFRGGVVAYTKEVKQSVLGVPEGPVVCAVAAEAMASGVASLMGADLAVALTGEAGPQTQEDEPPGTVWFGVFDNGEVTTERHEFDGDPKDVLAATLDRSVRILLDHARLRQ